MGMCMHMHVMSHDEHMAGFWARVRQAFGDG